jgi:predicted Zn-dependent protease
MSATSKVRQIFNVLFLLIIVAASIILVSYTSKLFLSDDQILKDEKALKLTSEINNIINTELESKPERAELKLAAYTDLPKHLKNRVNYALADLYLKKDEAVLAFMRLYEIDQDYLTRFVQQDLIELAEQVGDEAVIVDRLKLLIDKYPEDTAYKYMLAKSYLRQNLKTDAQNLFTIIQEEKPTSDYGIGAYYYLANIVGDENTTNQYLKKYLELSPTGNLAGLITQQIQAMSPERRKLFESHHNLIALNYAYNSDYKNAFKYFREVEKLADKFVIAYAKTLKSVKNKSSAARYLLDTIPKMSDTTLAKDALDYLLTLNPSSGDLANLRALAKKNTKIPAKIYWQIATITNSKSDYEKVYNNYPQSFYAGESLARVFIKDYKRGSFHNAEKLYTKHWLNYPGTNAHSQVAFLMGKYYLKRGNKIEAEKTLEKLIAAHPRDYYYYRAKHLLDEDPVALKKNAKWYKLARDRAFVSPSDWSWPILFDLDKMTQNYQIDVKELILLRRFDLLIEHLSNKETLKNDKFLMWLYAQSKEYLKAIRTAYHIIAKNDNTPEVRMKLIECIYPLCYAAIIADEAGIRNKVDPLLVQALMKQESTFQADIVSKVGAIGLMQLMPYTAKDVARNLNMLRPSANDLTKPNINIRLGVKYLEEVLQSFDYNMVFAIASYNAGPHRIRQWAKKYNFTNDPDMFVENIPYKETRNYVKKVLQNYWTYQELYF